MSGGYGTNGRQRARCDSFYYAAACRPLDIQLLAHDFCAALANVLRSTSAGEILPADSNCIADVFDGRLLHAAGACLAAKADLGVGQEIVALADSFIAALCVSSGKHLHAVYTLNGQQASAQIPAPEPATVGHEIDSHQAIVDPKQNPLVTEYLVGSSLALRSGVEDLSLVESGTHEFEDR